MTRNTRIDPQHRSLHFHHFNNRHRILFDSMFNSSDHSLLNISHILQLLQRFHLNQNRNTNNTNTGTTQNHSNTNHLNLTENQLISKVVSLMNQSIFEQSFDSFNQIVNGGGGSGATNDNDGSIIDLNFVDNFEVNRTEEEEKEIQLNLWIKIIFYVVYVLICLLGILGNVIVCYVVARKSSMHTVTNVFIANLALSDILLCLFAVPFTPLYLITFKSWIFGRVLCHLVPFAQGVSFYISAFTLMSIAIDRYFVILYPFKPRMLMRICIMIIVTIWISAAFLTFPYAHFMEFVKRKDDSYDGIIYYCVEQWPHKELSKTFGITTTVLQFVIPFLIITFCYVKICAKLSDRARTIPGNVSARREEQERERTRKTNGMLISMVIIFVISWLPLNIFNLLADFYEEATEWRYQRVLFIITHAIAMSSTCYNPFLYAWLNENFRKEFKEVLPCFGRMKSNSSLENVELRNNSNRSNSKPNIDNTTNNNNKNVDENGNNNESASVGQTSNSDKKLIKLCSKDGTNCKICVNQSNCMLTTENEEEVRQSLISKHQIQIRYDGSGGH